MSSIDSPAVYAHSLPGRPVSDWETLETHAAAVARLARDFAAAFGAAEWGELLGFWHDLGKRNPEFQRYIRGLIETGPPHAWVGAFQAARQGKTAIPAAFAVAGHHTGLADLRADSTMTASSGPTPLTDLVRDPALNREFSQLRPLFAPHEINSSIPALPQSAINSGSSLDLFTRFLFSALVDADRLATAAFYARFQPGLTASDLRYDDIQVLRDRLDRAIDDLPPKGN